MSAALAATRGNQIRAADLLGVNRNTLRKKIRDLEIQVYRTGGNWGSLGLAVVRRRARYDA